MTALLVVVTGKIIGDGYDTKPKRKDSSSSSSSSKDKEVSEWLQREIRKRKEEDKDTKKTEQRVEKEKRGWKEGLEKMTEVDSGKAKKSRTADVSRLREELKKRGLPLVALEDPRSNAAKGKTVKTKTTSTATATRTTGEKRSFGSKVRRAFLGRQLSDAMERKKGGMGTGATTVTTNTAVISAGGPGWKAADEAVAQAAVAGGAARAESLANRTAAEKAK